MGKLFCYLTFLSVVVSPVYGALLAYSNDFDNSAVTSAGVSGMVSGGDQTTSSIAGGVTDVQGYSAFTEFSGKLYRVTTPDDRLIIQVSGLDANTTHDLAFSLAMMDSWDGTSDTYGTDILNMKVHDGGTIAANMVSGSSVLHDVSYSHSSNSSQVTSSPFMTGVIVNNQQLGFNNNDPWWNEDGYSMEFNNLMATSGTITFEIWASSAGIGSGFQGGDDESFGIDNFIIMSNVPEPSTSLLSVLGFTFMLMRRSRI